MLPSPVSNHANLTIQILPPRCVGEILWVLTTLVVDSLRLRCDAVDGLGSSSHVGDRLLWS